MKKWVRRFWPRLLVELNRVAGLGALGGAMLAIAAFFARGALRVIFIAAGVIVVVGTAGIAIRRSLPPPLRSPQEVEGDELLLDDLDAIEPPVPTVGIIGPENVGKTTLRNLLLQIPAEQGVTQKVTAHISSVIRNPTTFLAILDGRGESYAHQFEVAEAAGILCVMMDHNILENETRVDGARLERHRDFGEQVRGHLRERSAKKKLRASLRLHLLLNKRDRWRASSESEQAVLANLLEEEASRWKAERFVDGITTATHSNAEAEDVTAVANAIKNHWTASRETGTE